MDTWLGVSRSLTWKEFYSNPKIILDVINTTVQIVILRSEATKNLAFSEIFQPEKEILRSLRSLRMAWWEKLRCSVNAVLTNPCFAEKAQRMQTILKNYQPAKTAADIIE